MSLEAQWRTNKATKLQKQQNYHTLNYVNTRYRMLNTIRTRKEKKHAYLIFSSTTKLHKYYSI